MISHSYIGRSGQMWKLWLALCMLVVGFLMLSLSFTPSISSHDTIPVILIFGGLGLSVIGLLWACLAVRCRNCRALLVWKAIKEQPQNKWLNWLITNKTCPYCQDSP